MLKGVLGGVDRLKAFTPLEACYGGFLIAVVIYYMLVLNGRATSVGNMLASVVSLEEDMSWKSLFVGGMLIAGALSAWNGVVSVESFKSGSAWVYLISGFLIGFGSRAGSGCTTGHAISGVARLSRRSGIATVIIWLSGSLTATIFHRGNLEKVPVVWPSFGRVLLLTLLLIAAIAAFEGLRLAHTRGMIEEERAFNVTAVIGGVVFALGLTVAGLSQQSKILGFLDWRGYWDATLLVALIAAVLPSLISYQISIQPMRAPLFTEELLLPMKTEEDLPLIVGSVIFGVGWGYLGLSPASAVVNFVRFNHWRIIVYVVAMLGGIRAHDFYRSKYPSDDSTNPYMEASATSPLLPS
ncbi:hypothetical protein CBR_g50753 [Chara braunii]|uniref:Uncharacterized protein n=1 Tax=Chara braunii TaxID=69332 RepID=A0A388K5Q8_CHABU|nr:hypothetical protein CBR_g50753 [Chara braunii]|eukprot:GBG65392.1 hypothetical protein CBR_g50753 [Chara braunii]